MWGLRAVNRVCPSLVTPWASTHFRRSGGLEEESLLCTPLLRRPRLLNSMDRLLRNCLVAMDSPRRRTPGQLTSTTSPDQTREHHTCVFSRGTKRSGTRDLVSRKGKGSSYHNRILDQQGESVLPSNHHHLPQHSNPPDLLHPHRLLLRRAPPQRLLSIPSTHTLHARSTIIHQRQLVRIYR